MPARTAKKPMPKKRSKRYQQAAKLVDADKTYSLGEACAIIGK